MKKLVKLSLLIFIPFLGGLLCQILGGIIENETLSYVGYMIMSVGTPVVGFGLVVVGLILIITGRINLSERPVPKRDNDGDLSEKTDYGSDLSEQTHSNTDDLVDESAAELRKIEEVNTSYGRESRYKNAEYVGGHIANVYRNSSKREKILGWLFFGFLMSDFFLIMVFIFLQIWTGMIVCFSIFVGTLIIAGIVKFILQKISMRANPAKVTDREPVCGEVKACLLSSSTNSGGGSNRSTTRITGVVYRVVILANGAEYVAYTDRFYNKGETVYFLAIGKRFASIVDENDINEKQYGA